MRRDGVTLDTNILVYALNRDAGERHGIASKLVERAAEIDCVLTLQALAEFFLTVTRKGRMPADDAAAQVDDWQALFVVRTSAQPTLRRAIAAAREHGLAFWDAMLWACAEEAGCTLLISEDFQHGRTLDGLRFHNPFVEPLDLGVS